MIPYQTFRAYRVRRAMWNYGWILYDHARTSLAYEQYRPMRSFLTPYGHLPAHATDCSESTSLIARASGAQTPWVTGDAQHGFLGYTGTMLAKLKKIPKVLARRGDFAVFVSHAEPTGEHVVMLMQSPWWRTDPLVWSHGTTGIQVWNLSTEAQYHPGCSIVFLQVVKPFWR